MNDFDEYLADARHEAELDEYYSRFDKELAECPECGELTLFVGDTQRFYEYKGGPEISPPETPCECLNCDYQETI